MRRWIHHHSTRLNLPLHWKRARRWSVWHSSILVILILLSSTAAINGWNWFATGQMVLDRIRDAKKKMPASAPLRGNMLFISPHPDDETLAAGGMISDIVAHGGKVSIIWITNGDGFEWDARFTFRQFFPQPKEFLRLGRERMLEAKAAGRALGVKDTDMYFLGFPDQGLMPMYTQNYLSPYKSKQTQVSRVPYDGTYRKDAPYTGFALERELLEITRKINPQIILAPSPLDGHPDHRVGGYMASQIWSQNLPQAQLYYYLVHGGVEWPLPKGFHPELALVPPQMSQQGQKWHSYDLTATSLEHKQDAISKHVTQLAILERFMSAFARQNELLLPAPPLEGTLEPAQIPTQTSKIPSKSLSITKP